MKKLLKDYGLKHEAQYFHMIEQSIVNGQFEQAYNQFKEMPRKHRKNMIKDIFDGRLPFIQARYVGKLIDLT